MSLVKVTMTLSRSTGGCTELDLFIPEDEILAKFNISTGKQATIDLHQKYFSPAISSLLRGAYAAEEQALYDEFMAIMAIMEAAGAA